MAWISIRASRPQTYRSEASQLDGTRTPHRHQGYEGIQTTPTQRALHPAPHRHRTGAQTGVTCMLTKLDVAVAALLQTIFIAHFGVFHGFMLAYYAECRTAVWSILITVSPLSMGHCALSIRLVQPMSPVQSDSPRARLATLGERPPRYPIALGSDVFMHVDCGWDCRRLFFFGHLASVSSQSSAPSDRQYLSIVPVLYAVVLGRRRGQSLVVQGHCRRLP